MTQRRSLLRSDQRGAVLVLGIMLGVFSVAALAYLANVGYASIWREGAQDAADAVVFESAVWEARGMNVLAAINIFIALTMAVLIAWRLAMFALGLLTVIAVVLCLFPATASVCAAIAPRLASATTRMATRDPNVTRNVYKVISVLHTGQTVVASALPILAASQSALSGMNRPGVGAAGALGTHLLPVTVLEQLQNAAGGGNVGVTASALTAGKPKNPGGGTKPGDTTKPGGGTKPGDTTKPGGKPETGKTPPGKDGCPVADADRPGTKDKNRRKRRVRVAGSLLGGLFSLPMERSEDLELLCPRGTEMLANGADLVFGTLVRELLGADVDASANEGNVGAADPGLFKTAFAKITGQLPTSGLCGDFAAMGEDLIHQQLDQACADNLTEQKTKYDPVKKDGETWQDACRRTVKKDLDDKQQKANTQQRDAAKKRGTAPKPAFAEVWGPFANGNLFAQSWSVASVDQDHSAIDRMIGLAGSFGGGSSVTVGEADGSALMLAQAELYFDCEGEWDGNCYPNAAWTLNWRARLRRVHSPFEVAAEGAERAASARFTEILQANPLQPLLAALPGGELTEIFAAHAGGLVPESLRRETEELRGQVAERGGAAARWVVEQGTDRASYIH